MVGEQPTRVHQHTTSSQQQKIGPQLVQRRPQQERRGLIFQWCWIEGDSAMSKTFIQLHRVVRAAWVRSSAKHQANAPVDTCIDTPHPARVEEQLSLGERERFERPLTSHLGRRGLDQEGS